MLQKLSVVCVKIDTTNMIFSNLYLYRDLLLLKYRFIIYQKVYYYPTIQSYIQKVWGLNSIEN